MSADNVATAIKLLDAAVHKLVVVLESGQVHGTVTDGDLRRHFLRGGSIDDPIKVAMNPNPILCLDGQLSETLKTEQYDGIDILVIVDEGRHFLDLHPLAESKKRFKKLPSTALLMAGGEGTRLRPVTNDTPKPMVKINGTPILERQILQLKNHGFDQIYISVNYLADQIIDYFGEGERFGVRIKYIFETKKLGTAGAIALLDRAIEDDFLLMNGDIVTDIDFTELKKFHKHKDALISIAAITHNIKVPFGVLRVEHDSLQGIDEKPVISQLCNAGIYMVNKRVLNFIPINRHTDITETIDSVLNAGHKVSVFSIYESWSDVGTLEDLAKVTRELNG